MAKHSACRDANSLPAPAKSTAIGRSYRNSVKNYPFWDYPKLGSLSCADGFTRAQTRQIGPFRRANRILPSHDRGKEEGGADTAATGRKAIEAPVIRSQIRGRRATDRRRGIHSDLSRYLCGLSGDY